MGAQVLGEGLVQQGSEFWAKPRGNPFFQHWREMIPVPSRLGAVRQILFFRVTQPSPALLLGSGRPAGVGASLERSALSLSLFPPEVINEMQTLC